MKVNLIHHTPPGAQPGSVTPAIGHPFPSRSAEFILQDRSKFKKSWITPGHGGVVASRGMNSALQLLPPHVLSMMGLSGYTLVLIVVLLICLLSPSAYAQVLGQTTRRAAGTSGSSYYSSSTSAGQATVSSDPETRNLVVVTDEDTAKYISQVISNLDRPAPQVLIKVVFMEVTYRKGFDVGIEGSYQKKIDNSTTGAVNQIFGLVAEGANPVPPGAGIYQVLGRDFQATLRAIAEAGKTEVLSRPSVLARNNQEAVITVGQQIPLITNVRYDNFGNQINAVTYQDVGIILRVTPFITTDGMVEMIVSPEISNLSEQTVAISAGVDAPVINSRSADTVVVTPDGQTVVIGGLMQNSGTETTSKIPVLGDIPLLGNLFKRKSKGNTKTELLIFLTPHVVRQPSQLASMADTERANTQLVPQSFSEQELNRFLRDIPVKPEEAPKSDLRKRRK